MVDATNVMSRDFLQEDGSTVTLEFITGDNVHPPLSNTSYAWKPIYTAINAAGKSSDALKIADFGAGAGTLGIFAKLHCSNASVFAYENNPLAFEYLQANILKHNVDVTAELVSVADVTEGDFDYIIATPPCLPAGAKAVQAAHSLNPEYSVYPGDSRGRAAHEVFIPAVAANLKDGGMVSYAHTASQLDYIVGELESAGLTVVETVSNDNEDKVTPAIDLVFTIATK